MYRHLAAALGLRYMAVDTIGANAFHRRAVHVDVNAVARSVAHAAATYY